MAGRMGTKLPPRLKKQKRTGKRPIPRGAPGGQLGSAPKAKKQALDIRRALVGDDTMVDSPYAPDMRRMGFKNREFGMKDMPAGYNGGGCVMKGRGGKFKGVS